MTKENLQPSDSAQILPASAHPPPNSSAQPARYFQSRRISNLCRTPARSKSSQIPQHREIKENGLCWTAVRGSVPPVSYGTHPPQTRRTPERLLQRDRADLRPNQSQNFHVRSLPAGNSMDLQLPRRDVPAPEWKPMRTSVP